MLVVTTVPGTVTGFLLPYIDHFRSRGWRVDVATRAGSGLATVAEHADEVHAMPWSRSPRDVREQWRGTARLRDVVRRNDYDLMHTHTPMASLLSRLALAGLGHRRPAVVYTAHGFHFHDGGSPVANRAYAAAERLAARWTDRLVVINDEDAAAAVSRRIIAADRVVRMPGIGIDLGKYLRGSVSGASDVREMVGAPRDAVLFTVVAELQAGKNHALALRGLARNGNQRYHLCLAGEGPQRPQIEALVEELGLGSRVHLLGRLADVRPLVLASAATVLPSRREGLSRAVLESLALGVPVIGSTARGVRDLVSPRAGVLVDPDDVAAMSAAFDEVQSMPTGDRLRGVLEPELAQYGIGHLIELHERVYDDLVPPGA
jgi:glycosyltransferase involved in cell wall biosynthesis